MSFQIGDKVRAVTGYFDFDGKHKWLVGELIEVDRKNIASVLYDCRIRYPDGSTELFNYDKIELVKEVRLNSSLCLKSDCWGKAGSHKLYLGKQPKGGFMSRLSVMAKTFLDADTQALRQAGYLDSELDISDVGMDALNAILVTTYKKEWVAAAKARIKEGKEEECCE